MEQVLFAHFVGHVHHIQIVALDLAKDVKKVIPLWVDSVVFLTCSGYAALGLPISKHVFPTVAANPVDSQLIFLVGSYVHSICFSNILRRELTASFYDFIPSSLDVNFRLGRNGLVGVVQVGRRKVVFYQFSISFFNLIGLSNNCLRGLDGHCVSRFDNDLRSLG